MLNQDGFKSWMFSEASAIAAAAFGLAKKQSGYNARSHKPMVESYSGPWHDRAVGVVRNTNEDYGVERELGGRVNPKPERALFHAMKGVSGGRAVASPKIVRGGTARRSKPKPFLNANKYSGGAR